MAEPGQSAHFVLLVECHQNLSIALEKHAKDVMTKLEHFKVLTEKDLEKLRKKSDPQRLVQMLLAYLRNRHAEVFIKFLDVLCLLEGELCATGVMVPFGEATQAKELLKCIESLVPPNLLSHDLCLAADSPCVELLRRVKEYVIRRSPPPFIHPQLPMEVVTIHKHSKLFYSPTLGVTVEFPPDSLPPDIPEFQLCVAACDPVKLHLPDDLVLYTPLIWIGTSPPNIKFARETVKVTLPHCLVIHREEEAESFVVLNLPDPLKEEDPMYCDVRKASVLDISTGVDFSDGSTVSFNVGCFCKLAGSKREHYSKFEKILRPHASSQQCPTPPTKKPHESTEEDVFMATSSRPRGSTWSHDRRQKYTETRKHFSVETSSSSLLPEQPGPSGARNVRTLRQHFLCMDLCVVFNMQRTCTCPFIGMYKTIGSPRWQCC